MRAETFPVIFALGLIEIEHAYARMKHIEISFIGYTEIVKSFTDQ